MFARMPCHRCIVAGLDDFGMELFVVRDIQFLFVVEESVEFFLLEKVVDQSARAFFTKYFESLSDFDFTIEAISNLLFKFWRFGKGNGSKCNKMRGIKDQLIPIVFSIRDLKACRARERVCDTVFFT
jgi:hypothetical protein